MDKKNNKINLSKKGLKSSSGKRENEYDLESNFKKVNSYSQATKRRNKPHYHITDSDDYDGYSSQDNVIRTPQPSIVPQRTGDSTVWNSYIRLDDKISAFTDKNDKAHTDLRRELENKIESSIHECKEDISKKLSKQWYTWTIVGLVAIASIFYIFSYQDVHQLPKQMQEIEQRVNTIEKHIATQSDTIKKTSQKFL